MSPAAIKSKFFGNLVTSLEQKAEHHRMAWNEVWGRHAGDSMALFERVMALQSDTSGSIPDLEVDMLDEALIPSRTTPGKGSTPWARVL